MKRLSPQLPPEFVGIYDEEKYQKSIRYHKVKSRLAFWVSIFTVLFIIVLIVSGFFGWLDAWLRNHLDNEYAISLSFFALVYLGSDLIHIPLQVYSTYVIEERFGFNKTSPKTFVLDKLKAWVLTLIITGGLLCIFIWFVFEIGPGFWWYFWGVVVVFMLVTNLFYTSWILPLFNKLSPLEDGELKQSLMQYAQKVNFPLTNIMVMDGSKRSTKANAFFSGMGKKKKIVLFDTLIEQHDDEELTAILAHEVGHYKKKHVYGSLAIGLAQSALVLFLLAQIIFSPQVSNALGGEQAAIHLNLLAFAILFSPISHILGVLVNLYSRKNEYEADAFAAETYKAEPLARGLKKLSAENLSHLDPHPWYVFIHYSHPTLLQRLRAMGEWKS